MPSPLRNSTTLNILPKQYSRPEAKRTKPHRPLQSWVFLAKLTFECHAGLCSDGLSHYIDEQYIHRIIIFHFIDFLDQM